MKTLRMLSILLLVLGMLLVSIGSAFAQNAPERIPATHPGPNLLLAGLRQGFFGNVTAISAGDITLTTREGSTVVLKLKDSTRYNLPGDTGWVNLNEFTTSLGGSLNALAGRRIVALASNVTGSSPGPFVGDAVKVMVIPSLQQPLFAHRTGIVIQFEVGPSGNGMITIVDVHNSAHQFTIVGNETRYFPSGMTLSEIQVSNSFITVVTTANPELQRVAKAIVVHKMIPTEWAYSVPAIAIIAPKSGANLGIGNITVTVKVYNFNIVNKLNQAKVAGEGHIHYFMDINPPITPGQPAVTAPGTFIATTDTSCTWPDVPVGSHTFFVELVNNDHTPLTPPVVDAVIVTVSAGY